jgi:uncharacterized protein YggL (DUF469 family)
MKKLTIKIDNDPSYKKVSYPEALREFSNGKEVLVKLSNTTCLQVHIENDTEFCFDSSFNFYIEAAFDENAIIVTRHKILERYFKEVMGINARAVPYCRQSEIVGKDVYGVIPVVMMQHANSITCVHSSLGQNIDEIDDLDEFIDSIIEVNKYVVTSENLYSSI